MRNRSILLFALSLAAGCGQPASETQNDTDSTSVAHDSIQATQVEEPMEEKKAEKLQLNKATLSKFSFATEQLDEYNFDENGSITISRPVNGAETFGRWSLSGSTLQISLESDTADFEVRSFNEGELNLRTTSESGGKMFGETDREGYYYIKLHRFIYSAPFSNDQISGGWQVSNGGAMFDPDGTYNFSAPDCIIKGTWEFSDGYLNVEITGSDCGSNVPNRFFFEMLRLAPGLMIGKNETDAFEVYTRQVDY